MVLPQIGFGCYNPKGEDNRTLFALAIETGYRYFDTASRYNTERELGQAIKDSGIDRKEIVVASKAWHNQLGYSETKTAFYETLKNLQTDYLDIYMMHWPRHNYHCDWKAMDLEAWRAMGELHKEGLIRGIGVSNFLPHHLSNLLENSDITPVIDQLELHPGYCQEAAVSFCLKNGVQPQAWGPLGRGRTMNNKFLKTLAEKHGRSIPQICIRFLIQKGIMPVVKSSSAERMVENTKVFDFTLSDDDMWMISCMPQDGWMEEHPDFAIPKVTD